MCFLQNDKHCVCVCACVLLTKCGLLLLRQSWTGREFCLQVFLPQKTDLNKHRKKTQRLGLLTYCNRRQLTILFVFLLATKTEKKKGGGKSLAEGDCHKHTYTRTHTHTNTHTHAHTHTQCLSFAWKQTNHQKKSTEQKSLFFNVVQCVVVCMLCSARKKRENMIMLQRVAVWCNVLERVAVCCSVLQCVTVCCSVLQCGRFARTNCCRENIIMLQCAAVCCSVL